MTLDLLKFVRCEQSPAIQELTDDFYRQAGLAIQQQKKSRGGLTGLEGGIADESLRANITALSNLRERRISKVVHRALMDASFADATKRRGEEGMQPAEIDLYRTVLSAIIGTRTNIRAMTGV